MKSPYDKRTEKTRARLFPFTSWYINKVYKQADGLYVFMNQRGYIHILKPCKVNCDNAFSHYEIQDLLLTPKDTVKEVACYGFYKTREDCVKKIEEKLAK